jgi:hypothetical protein
MPLPIPTMLLLNRVRMVVPPLSNAKSLSNFWIMRFSTYVLFGLGVVGSKQKINSFPHNGRFFYPTYGSIKS